MNSIVNLYAINNEYLESCLTSVPPTAQPIFS